MKAAILIGVSFPFLILAVLAILVWVRSNPTRNLAKLKSTAKSAVGFLFIGGILIIIVMVGSATVKGCRNELRRANAAGLDSRGWRPVSTFTVTDKPLIVPWQAGATKVSWDIPNPEDAERHLLAVNDGRTIRIGSLPARIEPTIGKPFEVRSEDGRPLTVSVQWKFGH